MPELDFAVLCEYVRHERGGRMHIVSAGIDTLSATEVPHGASFGLATRVLFTRSECGRPHRLELIIQGEDGERLGEVTGTVTPQWPEDHPVHWSKATTAAFNFGVTLNDFGMYSIDLLVNDSQVKALQFRLRERTDDA